MPSALPAVATLLALPFGPAPQSTPTPRQPVPAADRLLVRLVDLEKSLARWRETHPGLVHEEILGNSREGRPIRIWRIGPGQTPSEGLPEVLLLAGIHPREQQPTLGVLRFVDDLLALRRNNDTDHGDLLDKMVLWVVPAFNPDGKAWEQSHPDWRKNRAPLAFGEFGVDLNRNFSIRWGGARKLDPLWRTTTDTPSADIYEGTGPLSEPETRALAQFFARRPGMRAFLDIHSPLREILSPSYVPTGDGLRFARLIEGMRREQRDPYDGPTFRFEVDTPASERTGNSGLTYHHAYYKHGIFGLNFEFSNPAKDKGVAGRYPSAADADREYRLQAKGAWLDFLTAVPNLPTVRAGRVEIAGEPRTTSPAIPGATVGWHAPQLRGNVDWAVLVSGSAQVQVLSEVRYAPFDKPFTIRISPDAAPGTRFALELIVWDRARHRTVLPLALTVAAP
jgi:hypothetical protein